MSSVFKRSRGVIAAVSLLASIFAPTAWATTVRPLSFDEIAAQADVIALVATVNVRADWQTSAQGKHIVTTVTFRLERTLKGQIGQEFQLEFLGGNIAGIVMEVDSMPEFHVGGRDVLFLSANRNSVSPIVGLFQGRFRVEGDRAAGTEQILTNSGRPFIAAAATGGMNRLLSVPSSAAGGPVSYSQFEALVRQSVALGPAVTR